MLSIVIPGQELFNEQTNEFVYLKEQPLTLEHSLVSLSKWESKWETPFLSDKELTRAQTVDYVRCMTLTQNVSPDVYGRLSNANLQSVNDYINAKMTATWFSEQNKAGGGRNSSQQITAELIYYWMISLNIPFECQKWHLNRLLTLIRVCSIKNEKQKKMSKRDVFNQNAALNAARRKQFHSKG